MNIQTQDIAPAHGSAFRFTGTWREFAPIAFTNLLLTVVTLGIYRFWANARVRRYLWSRTEFIDDTLEWTGTGLEMFKGFLVAAVVVVPALLFLQFGFEAMVLRGQAGLAALLGGTLYFGLISLGGVAMFRALRYRLSRSYWRGIRGGSNDGGWSYGWSTLWKTVAGVLCLGLLVPWSMTQLWNDRWGKMSFGPHEFHATADTDGLMGRWLLVLISPIIAAMFLFIAMMIFGAAGMMAPQSIQQTSPVQVVVMGGLFVIGVYGLIALIGVGYYAAYFRKIIAETRLSNLEFAFTARSGDWLKLFLGNLGLAVATLGIGIIFWSYRNWTFFVRHLEAYGHIDAEELTQSAAAATTDAEGLAGMFDIGAI